MAIAYRSDTGKLVADNFTGTQNISFTTQPVTGDLVVAGGEFYGGGNTFTPTVTDNQGNTYALDVSTDSTNGGSAPFFSSNGAAIFSKANANNAGTMTLSFGTGQPGSYLSVGAIAFSGVVTTAALDVTQKANTNGANQSSQSTGTTAATSVADSVAITALGISNSGTLLTLTVSGYTVPIAEVDGTTHAVGGMAYRILTATGAQSATWTYGQSSGGAADKHAAVIAVYKGTGSGGSVIGTWAASGQVSMSGAAPTSYTAFNPWNVTDGTGRVVRPSIGVGAIGVGPIRTTALPRVVAGGGSIIGNYTASGSVTITGTTVPHARTKAYAPSGQVTMSGSPPRARTKAYVGSGQVTMSATPPGSPFLGLHGISAQLDGAGTSPNTVSLGTTQASGSSLVVASLGEFTTMGDPTDNKSSSFGTALRSSGYFGGLWPGFGMEIFAVANIAGGAGHVVSVAKTNATLEHSLIALEVRNGGIIKDSSITAVAGAGAGVAYTSASVTVDGPAELIAFWGGDGDAGTTNQTATPEGSFTLTDSAFIALTAYVQCAAAVRQVSAAGTYTCQWTPTVNQGAILGLVAIQSTGSQTAYRKTKAYAAAGTVQSAGAGVTSFTGLLNKTYAGSGLVQSSGTPPRSKGKAYLPSGGVTASGAPPRARTKVFTPAGGLSTSGAAILAKVKAWLSSGQETISGAGPTSFTGSSIRSYAGSGQLTTAGAALLAKTKAFLSSGQVTASGSPPRSRGKAFNASGSLVIAGAAIVAKVKAWAASGQVTLSGVAPTLFNSNGSHAYIGSGQVTITGTPPRSKTKVYTPTGGVQTSGAAVLMKTKWWAASGTVLVTGAAPTSAIRLRTYAGSGTVQTSGGALLSKSKSFAASGNLLVSGSAVKTKTKAFLTSGGVAIAGSAILAKLRQYYPSGIINVNGAAFTSYFNSTTTIEKRRTLSAKAPDRKFAATMSTRDYKAKVPTRVYTAKTFKQ